MLHANKLGKSPEACPEACSFACSICIPTFLPRAVLLCCHNNGWGTTQLNLIQIYSSLALLHHGDTGLRHIPPGTNAWLALWKGKAAW
jgi:hypothetical protein